MIEEKNEKILNALPCPKILPQADLTSKITQHFNIAPFESYCRRRLPTLDRG